MKAWMLGLALASCKPQPAQSEPTPWIFVFHEPHSAWFYSGLKATPVGNAIGDMPIATINDFRARSHPFCHLQQIQRSSFVGVDRATQLEIDADFNRITHDPFRQEFVAPDGRKLIARVGLGEECNTRALRSIVVVQDASGGWIEHFDVHLNSFQFLFPQKNGDSIATSTCLTCGDSDPDRRVYDAHLRKFSIKRPISQVDKPPPTELSVGQVIDHSSGDVIDGWSIWSVSNFPRRVESQYLVTETSECCTSLLYRGDSYLVVRTVPVSKVPADGAFGSKGRIVEKLKIDPLPDEELMECNLLWIEPAANLVNQKSNEVRSFVATPDGIKQINWTYEGDSCFFEDRD